MITKKPTEGLSFNGFDTTKNDMWLVDRSAPTPSEKPIIDSVPFMQGVYDFSMMMGERVFDNRPISYEFQIIEHNYDGRKVEQTDLENQLMRVGIQPLYDTHDPDYYYLGKCVAVNVEDDHIFGRLVISIEFDCYPFKISKIEEGNDDWDTFNFELDYVQDTNFYTQRTTFKKLSVGATATVGAWSTHYDGSETISKKFLGKSYIVTEIRTTDQDVSNTAYYLTGLNKWVIEQDVVQVQNGAIEIDLLNVGSTGVTPTIVTDKPITIIKGNAVYNVWAGTTKDELLRLNTGSNIMLVAGYNATFNFRFYKELI